MRWISRALSALGVALLVLGTVASVVNREVLDSERFLDHVDAVRADPHVSQALGGLLTDRIVAAQPDLTAVRPLLESAATAVVASPSSRVAARAAVTPLHQNLTGDQRSTVVLRLADAGAVLIASARALSPRLEATLPADLDVRLSQFAGEDLGQEAIWQVHLSRWLAALAPGLGLLMLFGAGWLQDLGPRRLRTGLSYVGRGAVAGGVTLAILLVVVGVVVGRSDETVLQGALEQAVWTELSGALWTAAALVASIGCLVVLATRVGGLPRLGSARPTLAARHADAGSAAAWAVGLLVLGGALVLQPLGVVRVLAQTLGLSVALVGLASLASSAVEGIRERRLARRGTHSHVPRPAGSATAVALGVVALLTVYVIGAVPADEMDGVATARRMPGTCNGHAELCSRRYEEVAFPATHNAMAAADEPGWFFAEQPDGMVSQLQHGIRVLLIDSWYGQQTSRRGVVANTDEERAAAIREVQRTVGRDAVQSALRLRDAFNLRPRGPVRPYLCHGLCELGSTPWLPAMEDVAAWVRSHPRDVVTFFIQDEVSPADTAQVIRRAGLRPFVHEQRPGEPWPTLGSMITSGRRVVLLMEREGGGRSYPWLLDGFKWVQDTPFLFRNPAAFSCAPNRGRPDAALFLVNHWITDKVREVSNARRVNSRDVLLPRLRECEAERDQLPNFVAVDFYDRGDLFDVVDTLNGF
jgi:hypothetical protein